jgi:beta-lactam-binding protein with PASTA domain
MKAVKRFIVLAAALFLLVACSSNARSTTIPDVIGKDQAVATRIVSAKGLKSHIEERYNETVNAHLVISEEPQAGTSVRRGGTITLIVSKGPAKPSP